MNRKLNFAEAINEAFVQAMEADDEVLCFGLGVTDPKGVFSTTLNLEQKFGNHRVFDMPTSENGMTGVAIGAAINGMRPVMTHQRVDFFLLAMDQLVNNAAKWHFMFGGASSVPITIRLIVGHGWGQGPTHSQNLQSMFGQIPGLKVVMPTSAYDAKGMLLESIFDNNPVIFIEHRWLHGNESEVPEEDFRIPLGKSRLISEGHDVTIVSMSYMTVETIEAVKELKKAGISCDHIDLRSVSPLDWDSIFDSVKKTGRLLAIDSASRSFSVSSEIISRVSTNCFDFLKEAPKQLALIDNPSPSSFGLTKHYYNRSTQVYNSVASLFNGKIQEISLDSEIYHQHDVPGDWFKGPF